ncbi:MAG: hypothetical protein JNJ70_07955 [Verrucomicrobiales bacterium]|nr:hypothetical protein [Verrucomicrobiales bacterium]
MKSLLACSLAAVILFSTNPASAKTYGGFSVRDTFKLKVASVTSTKQTGLAGVPAASPIPAGIPSFKKGKVISFRIAAKGKLTARGGINIPFAHDTNDVNEYNKSSGTTVNITHNAEIEKKRREAVAGTMSFFITDASGAETVYYTVVYKLK